MAAFDSAQAGDFTGINRLVTIEDRSAEFPLVGIGNAWTSEFYDGPFHVFAAPKDRPAISLVFVQSRNGNTAANHPADLGGGPTDLHLIYEGLSRVAADAVLAGATTVGHHVFFTVNHPELVSLRLELGLPRHPIQMVMSRDGNVDLGAKIFNTPDVRAFILCSPACADRIASQLHDRAWITLVRIESSLRDTFAALRRDHGIGRISAIGGRHAATSLVDAGVVQDIYLTTSAIEAGDPNTPWYVGSFAPRLRTIVSKREATDLDPLVFEHLAIDAA